MKYVLFAGSVLLYFLLQLQFGYTEYESASVALFAYYLIAFIYDLGKKMVILDVVILSAIFCFLIMPVTGYRYFNHNNYLARLWVRYMWVSQDVYFSFMFPATVAMILGLKIPIFYRKEVLTNHSIYLERAKDYVHTMKWEGLILIVIGIVASFLKSVVPGGLTFVFFLLSYLMFVGIFYCFYSQFPHKRIIMIAVFGALLIRSIMAGMFGELIFMTALTVVLVLLGKKIKFFTKLGYFLLGVFIVLVIQLVKPDFRAITWRGDEEENTVYVFTSIISDRLSDPTVLIQNELVWFNFYSRFNQGQIVSMVLRKVPSQFPFAGGSTIYESLAGSVVPRVLWPDKPEAGGVYNFKRFLGLKLVGYSVGISPYGEGWGNYGREGGILFMFFFGLLFNFFFSWLLKLSKATPSLLFWFPLLFFYAVKIETDVFTMVNSLTKTLVFTYLMYKLFPVVFRKKI